MKKVLSFLISVIIVFACSITVFAADASVTADKVSLSTTESTLIPVKVMGNSGLMGFKITVEYPVDKVEIDAVSRGELTSKGNFNTNLGINDGIFDVLWNNTENVDGDGALFVISAKAKSEITKDTEIKISFSQPDTFNESYKDVKFNCKNIVISAKKIETTVPTTEKADDGSTTKAPTPIDSSQVTDAVNAALEKFGYNKLSDVQDEKKFIAEVNKNLETITGFKDHDVSDMESLKSMYSSAYEGEFVAETTNNIDFEKINFAVEKALKTVGAKSIDEIKGKDKATFVKEVEKNLKEENPDTPNISEDLETDQALDIIKKIYNVTNPTTTAAETKAKDTVKKSSKALYIVLPVLAVLVIAAGIVIVIKKKNNKQVSND